MATRPTDENRTMPKTNSFTTVSFVLRFMLALLLVLVTYNPSTYSWIHWLNSDVPLVYKVATGILLSIGWVMYLRATWKSLGVIGTLLAAAFFGVIIWLLIEWRILTLDNTSIVVWAVEFILSGVLATGMSWSHIRRKISGQYDTDELAG